MEFLFSRALALIAIALGKFGSPVYVGGNLSIKGVRGEEEGLTKFF